MKTDVHMITNIVKQYLRELPEPLLGDNVQQFLQIGESISNEVAGEVTQNAHQIRALVKSLPEMNQLVLYHLIALLVKVSSPPQVESTKMVTTLLHHHD